MKDNNKNNTLLLTVIAIATLLVAVIGATFAYFSSTVNGEDPSIVTAGSALIELNFTSDDGADLSSTGIQPKGLYYMNGDQLVNEMVSKNAIISKTFKLTQSNNTDKNFTYDIYLVVDETTFVNDNPATIQGVDGDAKSLSAKLIGSAETGSAATKIVYVPGKNDVSNVTLTANDGTTTTVKGVQLGTGTFNANYTGTHEYTLEIYFLDSNEKQDNDRNQSFKGHIAIASGAASNKLQ